MYSNTNNQCTLTKRHYTYYGMATNSLYYPQLTVTTVVATHVLHLLDLVHHHQKVIEILIDHLLDLLLDLIENISNTIH